MKNCISHWNRSLPACYLTIALPRISLFHCAACHAWLLNEYMYMYRPYNSSSRRWQFCDIIHHFFWRVYLTFDLLSITFDLPVAVPDLSHDLGAHSWHFDPIFNHIWLVWPPLHRLFSSPHRFPGLSRYTGCVPRPGHILVWSIF